MWFPPIFRLPDPLVTRDMVYLIRIRAPILHFVLQSFFSILVAFPFSKYFVFFWGFKETFERSQYQSVGNTFKCIESTIPLFFFVPKKCLRFTICFLQRVPDPSHHIANHDSMRTWKDLLPEHKLKTMAEALQ
eukprot:EG_transcript_41438